MDTHELQARLALKYDTFENWSDTSKDDQGANLILLKGEIGFCEISSPDVSIPIVLFKVGNGVSKFNALPWATAKAADVYTWAKASDVVFDEAAKTITFVNGEGDGEDKVFSLNYMTETEVLNALKDITDPIIAEVAELSAEIDKLGTETAVEELRSTIQEVQNTMATTEDLAATNQTVSNLDGELTIISENFTNHVGESEAEFAEIRETITTETSKLATKQEVSEIQSTVQGLQNVVATKEELNTTNQTVATLEEELNSAKDDLATYKTTTDAEFAEVRTEIASEVAELATSEALTEVRNTVHSIQTTTVTKDELTETLKTKADVDHLHEDVYEVQGVAGALFSELREESRKYTEDLVATKDDKGSADAAEEAAKAYTDTQLQSKVGIETVPDQINTHNLSADTHADIRSLISEVSEQLETFLTAATDGDGDGKTIDRLSEVLALINENKEDLDDLTINKVNVSDIVSDLTKAATATQVLAASAGIELKTSLDSLQNSLTSNVQTINSDIAGLETELAKKAQKDHGTHVTYAGADSKPLMDGTATIGTAATVAKSDHVHPTDTSRASKDALDSHINNKSGNPHNVTLGNLNITASAEELNYTKGVTSAIQTQLNDKAASATLNSHTNNTTNHITSTERTNWNAAKTHADSTHAPSNAEKNQNAFSKISVANNNTAVEADSVTDTLTFAGSNVTITPDATNDKITFSVADGSTSAKGVVQLTNSTSSTSTTTAATPNSVKSAYDLANQAKTEADSAKKLSVSAGSTTQPVYFSSGKPVATTYTLGKSVPSDAVFTDTKYTHPSYDTKDIGLYKVKVDNTGHVSSTAAVTKADITALGIPSSDTTYGVVSTTADGLAPKRDGSTTKFLRADGTWAAPPDTDTKVTNYARVATTKIYLTGATGSVNAAQYYDSNVYLDTTAGRLAATSFKIGEGCNLVYDSTNKCVSFQFI
jgi:hypothetical protein